MKKIILYIFLSMMASCNSDPIDLDYIKSSGWQYDRGFKIGEGDFLSFDKESKVFSIKDKTIFYKGQARAIIKRLDKKNNEMIIHSIEGKVSGVYINIAEFTK